MNNVIRVVNAHYGRLDSSTCENNIGTPDTDCLFTGVRDVVHNRSAIMLISDHGCGNLGAYYIDSSLRE